jgi:hypothetical protein
MAQAADSPTGFQSPAKVPDLDTCLPGDGPLAELHAWQASTAGLIESELFSLGSTVADLKRLAATPPLGLRLLVVELPDLELIQTEITRLISEVRATRDITA